MKYWCSSDIVSLAYSPFTFCLGHSCSNCLLRYLVSYLLLCRSHMSVPLRQLPVMHFLSSWNCQRCHILYLGCAAPLRRHPINRGFICWSVCWLDLVQHYSWGLVGASCWIWSIAGLSEGDWCHYLSTSSSEARLTCCWSQHFLGGGRHDSSYWTYRSWFHSNHCENGSLKATRTFHLRSLGTARLALPCLPCSSWWILLDLLTAETAYHEDHSRTWASCCRLWLSGPFWWSSWLHMPHWSPFLLWVQRIQHLRLRIVFEPWLLTCSMCCLSFGCVDLQSSSCHFGPDHASSYELWISTSWSGL